MAPSWVTPEWPSCILSAPSALLAQKKVFYREKKKKRLSNGQNCSRLEEARPSCPGINMI
jgi:hypothetical protein